MDILIEEQNGGLWVAVLKNGRLEGLEIDPVEEEVRWGSIYHARVTRISKTLDAAFLDLDGDNTGILYNRDVRIKNKDGTYAKGGDKAIGQVLKPGQLITVQAKSTYMPAPNDDFTTAEQKTVQMSMDITLPGRFMIFCPMMQENRISMRISDKKTRKQIHAMMAEMPDVKGCILRVAAAFTQTDILVREFSILMETWSKVQEYLTGDEFGLIMLGPDAIQRTLSDQASQKVDCIEIAIMKHYEDVEDWCVVFAPELVPRIKPIELFNATEDLALFHYRDIIGQIEALLHPYVLLPSGGNIIVQDTAALTAIDVNKAGDKGANLSTNIEAVQEVARQMRLRNIGGIIMLDILKPHNKVNEEKIMDALRDAIAHDPCTVQIHGKTNLGLIEITRRRRTPPLHERFTSEELY